MADLKNALPKTWASPTMSPHCDDEMKYGVVDEVVKHFEAAQAKGEKVAGQPIRDLVTVNGVRVTVEDGTWGLVRASSNKPELVVVVESPVSEARMRDMFKAVDAVLRTHRKSAPTTRRSEEVSLHMRVAILGAGPAGLYLAYLIKRRRPDAEVRVIEQNPRRRHLRLRRRVLRPRARVPGGRRSRDLRGDHAASRDLGRHHARSWRRADRHRRHRLCRHRPACSCSLLLQERARSVGVEPVFERAVARLDELGDADLVVGADGVNSLVRRSHARAFGATMTHFSNRFAWFGTAKPFETLHPDLPRQRASAISTPTTTAMRRA